MLPLESSIAKTLSQLAKNPRYSAQRNDFNLNNSIIWYDNLQESVLWLRKFFQNLCSRGARNYVLLLICNSETSFLVKNQVPSTATVMIWGVARSPFIGGCKRSICHKEG